MSRWSKKKKRWLDNHSRKGKKRKVHSGRILYPNRGNEHVFRTVKDNKPTIVLTPPKRFSLTENTEETMSFFVQFAKEIERKEYGKSFFIDSSEVEFATVDAIIYLIAILQNDTLNVSMNYSFSGNYPKNKDANRVYSESGFNNYVHSRRRVLPSSTSKMRIVSGIRNDSEVAGGFCDFVISSLNKTRRNIIPLQKVLIELMSNVYYHAYAKNTFMAKRWYMYAEHREDYVLGIFVDTGQGIAKTVKTRFGERLKRILGLDYDDAKLIKSAFSSDIFRSSTNERHRGNGLQSVRRNVQEDIFEEFEVFSGRGRCIMPKDDDPEEIISVYYKQTLYGTLFKFIIR